MSHEPCSAVMRDTVFYAAQVACAEASTGQQKTLLATRLQGLGSPPPWVLGYPPHNNGQQRQADGLNASAHKPHNKRISFFLPSVGRLTAQMINYTQKKQSLKIGALLRVLRGDTWRARRKRTAEKILKARKQTDHSKTIDAAIAESVLI